MDLKYRSFMKKVKNKRNMIIVGLSLFLPNNIFRKLIINKRIIDVYYDKDINKFVLLLGSTPSVVFLEMK